MNAEPEMRTPPRAHRRHEMPLAPRRRNPVNHNGPPQIRRLNLGAEEGFRGPPGNSPGRNPRHRRAHLQGGSRKRRSKRGTRRSMRN